MFLFTRIRKRSKKSLDWLKGWFHAHVTLRWLCWTRRPLTDLSLFQRRMPFIERREYSQNGEDGIIAAIFAKIGTTNKYCVEFGVEDGLQCNCRYLLKHRGWTGLLMDGGEWPTTVQTQQQDNQQQTETNPSAPLRAGSTQHKEWERAAGGEEEGPVSRPFVERAGPTSRAEALEARRGGTGPGGAGVGAPVFWLHLCDDKGGKNHCLGVHREFITAENIEPLFKKYGVPAECDLLSIDIDGNDYWVWKAITHFHPRVVIMEYNANKGPELSVTIPYDPAFIWDKTDYQGASLKALEKLGREKGYTLVATDRNGVNAFFVLDALVPGNFVPPPFAQIFHPAAYKGITGKGHPADPKGRPWVTIS
ncbi:MAG TPA: hypothetical protein DEB30_00430 [Candidatus Peribacter riflensis]|uniref:Methyltransferase FkbM domain-containing protein n=1 Tax=Candidatus Peribacter riflensis TaxID=1735162 RepID=A0A0S1SPW6_9BACT|nr:MAG: hypothetical protein PeribacterA2_0969 [Candidatus Peribacter riflensis]OGJ78479.1 MAG: hypothetical protein A2398_02450 [Candidatus Peribacteria bacterium RIFOXYB1_FULL_57_12]ALM11432.1 MAG: hypothetical protein PeribacterB2_0971 [Candidatus Peribacter riflensis]ALM12534.1 MAG: hypothetical protein PeribacterC2_0970 [Candidatus Peribacter riflensis]ALM13635.1 MAG: hypothetical protein PeribacterD1_0969 [Candidatus Peribacter riflensis]